MIRRPDNELVKQLAAGDEEAFCELYAGGKYKNNEGENYEFSAGASSSAEIVHTDNPALYKLFHAVAGESARYEGDVSEELLARFQARILFIENVSGIVNYYCYSPVLSGGVALGGEVVNLHIAVGECMTAAGTPVIFGGF